MLSGGESYGKTGAWLGGAGVAAERGRSYSERKWLCRFEEIFVGMLILERVYSDKEKFKTNKEYTSMVSAYRSAGKCFCTAVLQEARWKICGNAETDRIYFRYARGRTDPLY